MKAKKISKWQYAVETQAVFVKKPGDKSQIESEGKWTVVGGSRHGWYDDLKELKKAYDFEVQTEHEDWDLDAFGNGRQWFNRIRIVRRPNPNLVSVIDPKKLGL